MNSLEQNSVQTIPGPLFSLEYSEIGCQVAEDFWRYFMATGSENLLNESTSPEASNSDFEESYPSSPSNTFLSSPHEPIQHLDPSSIKEEPFEDRHSSSEEFHEPQDFLFLSREDLLKLSSKELEDYAQTLAATRPLTVEEEKLLKRQRRLIKNRESAQLSRQRKKIYIEDLERQVSALTAENIHLSKKLSALSVNNHSLVEEVIQLQKVVKKNQSETHDVVPKKKQASSEQNLRKAGLCLMMVLFSFGLFMNPAQAPGAPIHGNPVGASLSNGILGEPALLKQTNMGGEELNTHQKVSPKREPEREEEEGQSKRRKVASENHKSEDFTEESVLSSFSNNQVCWGEETKHSPLYPLENSDTSDFIFFDASRNPVIPGLEVD